MSEQTIAVVVPANIYPGDRINVATPDNRMFEVVIPPNTSPGQTIHVVVPGTVEAMVVEASPSDSTVSTEHSAGKKTVAAAGLAAVVGTVMVGPIVGVGLAVGAVYATTRSDSVGDAALAVGDATYCAVESASAAARKYGVYDKAKEVGSATMTKMKEIDQEYKVVDNAKAGASVVASKASEINQKYDITGTASRAILSGITMGAKEVTKLTMSSSISSSSNTR